MKFTFLLCPQLKEQAADSISVLEGALRLKKDFYVHTLRTLDLLAADAAANGETESSTAGLCISADELHCQVWRFTQFVLLDFILGLDHAEYTESRLDQRVYVRIFTIHFIC